jgi:hypothetical protein
MGLTHVRLRIANPAKPQRTTELKFLVELRPLPMVLAPVRPVAH